MDTENRGYALVTGASAGIGAAYARHLARRGHDLVLVARRRDRLAAAATEIEAATGRKVSTIAADLADARDLGAIEAMLRTDPRITLLVNNAGAGGTATLLQSDVAEMSRMIALNVEAPVRLTRAALPGFVTRGGGTIVNIASVLAVAPENLPGAVYAASKAFLLTFSQSLRLELAGTGVRVQVVLPGATGTAFWDGAGTPLSALPAGIVMDANDLVAAALSGLDMGEAVTLPALPDAADWEAYERARHALLPNLSRARPAARYHVNSDHDQSDFRSSGKRLLERGPFVRRSERSEVGCS